MHPHLQALAARGQSIWLDDLRREFFGGELERLIADGVRGLTSNPTIFENAILRSDDYDADIAQWGGARRSDAELFETLMIADGGRAADLFRPLYDATRARDGYVSLEVPPASARDATAAMGEARRLWSAVARPNIMIKVPGTREGWPAIERLLFEGINVNITLLFSVEHYRAVADAYLRALEARVTAGQPIHHVASVASFFISRLDSAVDARLAERGDTHLQGHAAIANARLAYRHYQEVMASARWRSLRERGAMPQRLLWASTATKNPRYADLMYVESLVGADTVNTLPLATLSELLERGVTAAGLDEPIRGAPEIMLALSQSGIDLVQITRELENEGIAKFAQSYGKVLAAIAHKRQLRAKTAGR